MAKDDNSRMEQARETAATLLTEMETESLPVTNYLMKAKRLARLLRDSDAQKWLDFETTGYPKSFDTSTLGNCRKYAVSGGRVKEDGKYYTASLPELEANTYADRIALSEGSIAGSPPPVKNYLESGATIEVLTAHHAALMGRRTRYAASCKRFESIKASLHSYVTDSYLAIELSDVAEGVFQEASSRVHTFVRAHCPGAAEQLVAMDERMVDRNSESLSAALNACRRLLLSVADVVFPAQPDGYVDSSGKSRAVGPENYKNRILAFLDQKLGVGSTRAILQDEVGHLAARLDSLYELACKGVHSQVTRAEANLAIVLTYLLIGEVARVYEPSAVGPTDGDESVR